MRLVRLTSGFLSRRSACGALSGTPAGRDLAATVADLAAAAELPAPDDVTTLLEDPARGVSALVHVRRVTRRNLWVWYRLNRAGDVVLVTLENEPPA